MDIVIKGMGVYTPLGANDEFFLNIFKGKVAWRKITKYENKWKIPSFIACAFKSQISFKSMINQSLRMACKDANINKLDDKSTLVCFASSNGLNDVFLSGFDDRVIQDSIPIKMLTKIISKFFSNFKIICFNTACASGGDAIAYACRELELKKYTRAIVIGGDVLSPITASGFMSLGAMSLNGCKPFTENRDGMSLGEGVATLILTNSEMDKSGYASIVGIGQANDHYHITAPNPQGLAVINTMRKAIEVAKIKSNDISYINAHGTGTKLNDAMEMTAFHTLFAHLPYISSSKGQVGHTLGAAGVIEAAITAVAVKQQIIPPLVIGNTKVMEKSNFIINTGKKEHIKYALSNSIGFGGNAVTICFKK